MSNSIKLSPKYGVNPTIPRCFFCGGDKSEVALLGKLPNDVEAPMYAIIDYEPCDKCKEDMAKGITLIGVEDHAFDNRPPINTKDNNAYYPTGAWIVLKEEAAKRIFQLEDDDEILKNKKCLVNQKLLEEINNLYDSIPDDSKEEN